MIYLVQLQGCHFKYLAGGGIYQGGHMGQVNTGRGQSHMSTVVVSTPHPSPVKTLSLCEVILILHTLCTALLTTLSVPAFPLE